MTCTSLRSVRCAGLVFVLLLIVHGGCASASSGVFDEGSQVQLRAIQSRAFDTTDRSRTLRTVMATLQDLGFVVDSADEILGSVSATKLDRYAMRMTVTVRERGAAQLLVRGNAQFNNRVVSDPEPYQQFFAALEKAMFLDAHLLEPETEAASG